jgi:predicted HAD superfamily Cof-like phosphohydrolase
MDDLPVEIKVKVDDAGEFLTLLLSAQAAAGKSHGTDSDVWRVLGSMAEMVDQELHISANAESMFKDIIAFHKKFGLEYTGKPRALEGELYSFRAGFADEELNEYKDIQPMLTYALVEKDDAEIARLLELQFDALIDLVYVALGTAYLHGFPFIEGWRRVHEKNMIKVRAERAGDSKRGSTFDVVKPEGWTPPSHADLVSDHAHQPLVK